jgi:hypothetical protein
MPSPFPGMDPFLEQPGLWPDVHNSLVAAIRDSLVPQVAPRYFIGLERRALLLTPDDIVFVGRPDLSVVRPMGQPGPAGEASGQAVLDVEVPIVDEVGEYFLEIREVPSGEIVTVVELLSPVNKIGSGRAEYIKKRLQIFKTLTNLVEIDLLRAGEPMPIVRGGGRRDYSVLVSHGAQRPHARLYTFDLREPIPNFPLPLLPGDDEPDVELNSILHAVYERARYDLVLDYSKPAIPPIAAGDAIWAQSILGSPPS